MGALPLYPGALRRPPPPNALHQRGGALSIKPSLSKIQQRMRGAERKEVGLYFQAHGKKTTHETVFTFLRHLPGHPPRRSRSASQALSAFNPLRGDCEGDLPVRAYLPISHIASVYLSRFSRYCTQRSTTRSPVGVFQCLGPRTDFRARPASARRARASPLMELNFPARYSRSPLTFA